MMPQFPKPPLPRHVALQPFSRDHYTGLVQARRLTTAADAGDVERRAALRGFLDVWHTEIEVHFDDEERLLADLAEEPARERLLDEHRRLRALAAEGHEKRRQVDPGVQWIRELGQLLSDHIRWEERELFPAIQEGAEPSNLEALGAETAVIEQQRPRSRVTGDAENAKGTQDVRP